LPDLFAGAPVLLGLKLRPDGGDLWVRGSKADGSVWEQKVRVDPIAPAQGRASVVSLFGRELVEDLELRLAAGDKSGELRAQIESAGLKFAIATRLTSWVAISEDITVDPTKPLRRVRMPHELPHGTSVHGIGLRAARTTMALGAMARGRGLLGRSAGSWQASAAAAPGVSSQPRSLPSRRLRGRVVLAKPRLLVVNIAIDNDLSWGPSYRAEVEWSDGTRAIATIDAVRSTAPARVVGGQSIRLCLQFADDVPSTAPVFLRLDDGMDEFVVMLGAFTDQ
jgi:hypothetical protein